MNKLHDIWSGGQLLAFSGIDGQTDFLNGLCLRTAMQGWTFELKKIDIVEFDDKKLCYVKSGMGYPAIYPMYETHFEPKAEAILMDLDGTSV